MKAKSKEQLMKETYDYYWMSALDISYSLDNIDNYFTKNIMGFGTPIDEKFFSIDEVHALILRQREQSVGIEMGHVINPVYHSVIANGNAAVFVDEVILTMKIDGNKHEIFLRNTIILEFLNNKWKIIHFHCSEPVNAKTETDTWNIEGWKRKNEELQKLVDERTHELRTSLEKLKSTQNQLIQSEKLASLGELTAGIAHEIQNPLNFVNNFSELSVELIQELKSPLTPDGGILDGQKVDMELLEDVVVNLEKINLHGKRASSIVKGMLEHSRASTGIKELTDINKLADEYLRLSYHGLRAKDKDFNSDFELIIDENLPKINVIPQDIGRVLLNIINNAFQSPLTPDGGIIRPLKVIVSTKLVAPPSGAGGAEGLIIVSVTDNGSGMSEATKTKIFQPFFTTKPTGQGTGLGLSLAYDIITKGHGGTIECESVEGEGTTFIVKLPIQ